jgi:hypothetical protein
MRDPQQSGPWYREPWPWLLMAGPFAAIVGGLITAYIAVANDDPLVVDNYYKEGLAINRVLERDQAASQRGYHAQVLFSEDHSRVRVHLAGASDALPDAIVLRLVHPTRAAEDRTVTLKAAQAGWYEGAVAQLGASPRWDVQLEGAQRDWRLTGQWRSAEGNAIVLQPRG